ncbi:MAG: class F sortase [Marmoricola sp.]
MPTEQTAGSYWAPQVVAPPPPEPERRKRRQKAPKPPREPRGTGTGRVRRVLKLIALIVVLGVCGALPWVVPQVPDWFGSKVPQTAPQTKTTDPTVVPPTPPSKGGAVIPAAGLVGMRLHSAGKPLQLVVKRLKVNSPVVPISGQSGELLPPSNPQELGWWQEGRVAGARDGGVVITGHTVHTGGGAFDHLGELYPGDTVRVRTAKGWIGYVVVRAATYSTKELAKHADEIFSRNGDGHLVLITCSDFNGTIYLSNSVVYAVPVSDGAGLAGVE